MEIVLLLIGLAFGGAVGYNLGQKSRPSVQARTAADAIVQLVRFIQQQYGTAAAAQIKGAALSLFRGDMRDHMEAQFDQDPLPPVG